jgi:2-polyprenyl-6-methoxyphenol hydroxylase-like FAD-dependent oxidoreductase
MIVGAGPTGLMLANLLGDAGVACLVIDRRTELPAHSRAIGVSPPSLDLLGSLGLADALIRRGVAVRDARVSDGGRRLGSLTFRHLPGPYPFILSVPQRETMGVLEQRLPSRKNVRYREGTEFLSCTLNPNGVRARVVDLATGGEEVVEPRLLIGCDGSRSTVRKASGIRYRGKQYGVSFLMADFQDDSGLGADAVLFFTTDGAVESFPLPGGARRWIAQTDGAPDHPGRADLVDCVRRRTGIDLSRSESSGLSSWRPERLLCRRFHRDRVLLCGDAAHVMSPIGGQGMNTGLADAEMATHAIVRHLEGRPWDRLCAGYGRRRRRAFRVAADRAALGMWLGTRTGAAGRIRNLFLKYVLLGRLCARWLPRHFAMLTIPYGRLDGETRGPRKTTTEHGE